MSREPKEPKPSGSNGGGAFSPERPGNSKTPEQRANRRRNRGNSESADWQAVDPAKLVAVIAAVTQHGYAIRFGYTKDGGAYAIGIIGDGEPFTEFVRPTEDINLYFDGLVLDYGK